MKKFQIVREVKIATGIQSTCMPDVKLDPDSWVDYIQSELYCNMRKSMSNRPKNVFCITSPAVWRKLA